MLSRFAVGLRAAISSAPCDIHRPGSMAAIAPSPVSCSAPTTGACGDGACGANPVVAVGREATRSVTTSRNDVSLSEAMWARTFNDPRALLDAIRAYVAAHPSRSGEPGRVAFEIYGQATQHGYMLRSNSCSPPSSPGAGGAYDRARDRACSHSPTTRPDGHPLAELDDTVKSVALAREVLERAEHACASLATPAERKTFKDLTRGLYTCARACVDAPA